MKKTRAILVAFCLFLFSSVSTQLVQSASPDEEKYRFEGNWVPYPGNPPLIILSENVNGTFEKKPNGGGLPDGILAYCFDMTKQYPWHDPGKNMFLPLNDINNYYDNDQAEMLRAILLNGFPVKSVEELESAAGVTGLNQGMALRTTQYAIWTFTNGWSLEAWKWLGESPGEPGGPTPQEEVLFNYLIELTPVPSTFQEADVILFNQQSSLDANKNLVLSISYKATEKNFDGTVIWPSARLDSATISKYPNASVTEATYNPSPDSATLTITIPNGDFDNQASDIEIGLEFALGQAVNDLFAIPPVPPAIPPAAPEDEIQVLGAVTVNVMDLQKNALVNFSIPVPPTPPGGGTSPPDGGGTTPPDGGGTTPPDDDTTPPDDDTTPPDDDTTPPDDDTTPPDDDTTPPDDDTTPPDDGTTPPGGGTTPPDGGTTPPDGGTTPPDGGTPLLPKTGESSNALFYISGVTLIIVALWMLRRRSGIRKV
ncbi:Cys-Gln thioester bond-forming surface protein [Paenibacillaceae bacterium WGS1546]|uniref:Cys-Gln thioester bond-forming surface protein n=1 Tax=Cohnella sp. WGS1546 TaxID=3366810 RepID=UPI00372D1774